MNSNVITLGALTCPSCMKKIETAVNELDGVERIKILFNTSKAKVIYDENLSISEIIDTIETVGYEVKEVK